MVMKMFKLALVAGASLASIASANAQDVPARNDQPTPANDQSANGQSATDASSNGDIIVTATKRSESVQKVPLAITAIGGEALKDRGVTSFEGLAPSLPSVNFGKNVGFARIAIRGLGLDATVGGSEGRVAYHTDGIYISRPSAQLATFFDINRVEVVRGPQGTLYG
ncbi:MAG TPA: TonB-dependent receptor plug domain-containing protein, partial [Sphingomonas sp.]|nr:TonB-dependent receptor plug domain-containing protein [Sphingomonas sp.]